MHHEKIHAIATGIGQIKKFPFFESITADRKRIVVFRHETIKNVQYFSNTGCETIASNFLPNWIFRWRQRRQTLEPQNTLLANFQKIAPKAFGEIIQIRIGQAVTSTSHKNLRRHSMKLDNKCFV